MVSELLDSPPFVLHCSYQMNFAAPDLPLAGDNLVLQADVPIPERVGSQLLSLISVTFHKNHDLYISCVMAWNCISTDFHEWLFPREPFV